MFTINPTLTIQINENNTLKIKEILENKTYEISDSNILKLFSKINRFYSFDDIILKIVDVLNYSEDEAYILLEKLIEYKLILSRESIDFNKNKIKWLEKGWTPSLLHYSSSRNINFLDIGGDNDKELSIKFYENLLKSEYPPIKKKISNYDSEKFILLNEFEKDNSIIQDDFYKVLLKRRTHRGFREKKITFQELSNLLYISTQDARKIRLENKNNINEDFSLYTNSVFTCNELYLYVSNVEGIEPGIYYYDILKHGIQYIKQLPSNPVGYFCYGQPEIKNSAITIFISTNFKNYMWRYNHERAYRNLLIDTAQLAQSIIITATDQNKKTFLTPALRDQELVNLFNLEKYIEDIRYLVSIGN